METNNSRLTPWAVLLQLFSHVWLFMTPWTAAHQASLFFTISWSLLKLMSIESMMPSSHLILCYSLLFMSSILPSIRVFSKESVLRIRWPKCWRFSFIPWRPHYIYLPYAAAVGKVWGPAILPSLLRLTPWSDQAAGRVPFVLLSNQVWNSAFKAGHIQGHQKETTWTYGQGENVDSFLVLKPPWCVGILSCSLSPSG